MTTTWVLVCDASRARLFAVEGKGRPWKLLRELEHPASRAHGLEITTDKAGRASVGPGIGSARAPATPPKEVEAEHFAQTLADMVEKGCAEDAFGRLVLVAPPHFLGLVRKSLSSQATKRIAGTLDKDLTLVEARHLPERLEAVV
jgi:protein required for attachment to host cells